MQLGRESPIYPPASITPAPPRPPGAPPRPQTPLLHPSGPCSPSSPMCSLLPSPSHSGPHRHPGPTAGSPWTSPEDQGLGLAESLLTTNPSPPPAAERQAPSAFSFSSYCVLNICSIKIKSEGLNLRPTRGTCLKEDQTGGAALCVGRSGCCWRGGQKLPALQGTVPRDDASPNLDLKPTELHFLPSPMLLVQVPATSLSLPGRGAVVNLSRQGLSRARCGGPKATHREAEWGRVHVSLPCKLQSAIRNTESKNPQKPITACEMRHAKNTSPCCSREGAGEQSRGSWPRGTPKPHGQGQHSP